MVISAMSQTLTRIPRKTIACFQKGCVRVEAHKQIFVKDMTSAWCVMHSMIQFVVSTALHILAVATHLSRESRCGTRNVKKEGSVEEDAPIFNGAQCSNNNPCKNPKKIFCKMPTGMCKNKSCCQEGICERYGSDLRCNTRYNASCGCDGVTYSSSCCAYIKGHNVWYKGECKKEDFTISYE